MPRQGRTRTEKSQREDIMTDILGGNGDPERRLMIATLEDSIDSYLRYCFAESPEERRLFLEAADWIKSQDRAWPYSFENVCETLGLAPDYLRTRLEILKTKIRESKTPMVLDINILPRGRRAD